MVLESKGKSDGSASLIALGRGLLAKPENNPKNESEMLDCPILEVFKVRLHGACSNLVLWKVSCPWQGWMG